MDIGHRLQIAREAIGYTQETVSRESRKTGQMIGASSISAFENNDREPKFWQLSRLAEIYKRPIEFFLSDKPIAENVLLWRDPPSAEKEMRRTEAEFNQLCSQYRNLEILMDEVKNSKLPLPDVAQAEKFDYDQAEFLAKTVQEKFLLGDIPIASLKQILEEVYYVKIFYLNFSGSAISTVSEEFGPAILLNAKNKQWRRSYDLAHELFHLLTWDIFRSRSKELSEFEEKLANAFASRLLMPEESIKDRVKASVNDKAQISLHRLNDIAREFDVSLTALIYRIAGIYRFKKQETTKYIDSAEKYLTGLKQTPLKNIWRCPIRPDRLPERYCDLAQRALREGKLSLMQFTKYMGITYRKAQKYLREDEDFKDEEISIPVT